MQLPTGAGSPTNLNVVQVGPNSFRVSWTPVVTVDEYWVCWSVGGQYDSGNMSVGAGDTAVTITGRTTYVTYDVTVVAFSDHLPSPVAVVTVTLGELVSVCCIIVMFVTFSTSHMAMLWNVIYAESLQ